MMKRTNKGFTLIELLLVMGIVVVIFGFITLNLTTIVTQTPSDSFVTILISDLRKQQLDAMNCVNESLGCSKGIYFSSNYYVLFSGEEYDPSESSNFRVDAPPDISLVASLPQNEVVFTAYSGEVVNYSSESATLQVIGQGKTDQIVINELGMVQQL